MDKIIYSSYKIADRSYVSFIKREIHNLVLNNGFSSVKAGEIDIVVSEMTSNLIKYAEGGELIYRLDKNASPVCFELFCVDNGKGIANVARMMKDGNTSSSSLGQGLGAIGRLSDSFQIYTLRNWGTVLHSKICITQPDDHCDKKPFDYGAIQLCAPGETVCGDGYHIKSNAKGMQIFVGDGLGHGAKAHEAVQAAIESFKICPEKSPADILRFINQDLKKTRGAVITIASVDYSDKQWRICGVGNISTRIYEGLLCKNYSSYNGIVGHNIPRTMTDAVYKLEQYQTIVMHSDGIHTRWNMAELPALLKFDPAVISAAVYKDNSRGNDDVTVLTAKLNLPV